MPTARDGFVYIAESQAGKAAQANLAFDAIDARFDGGLQVDLSAGNGSATLAQIQGCYIIQGQGATVARNLTLAPFIGGRLVQNGGSAEVTVKVGTAAVVLPPESIAFVASGGGTNDLTLLAGPWQSGGGSFAATTLTGDTSGTALCVMPRQGAYDKEVLIYLSNYQQAGTAQFYTFPTAFTHVPVALADVEPVSTIIASKVTLANTMASGVTGWIILKGF